MKQDLIRITRNIVRGKLPDPFLFEDGSRVRTKEDWLRRREELFRIGVELPYGDRIPTPEYFRTDPLCLGSESHTYRITAGPKDCPVSFYMHLFMPDKASTKPWPVVIDGDMCWCDSYNREWLGAFLKKGIAVCMFNRCEIVSDVRSEGKRSPLYRAYPDLEFGALMAWAWGYSRCLDALLSLGYTDGSCVAFTGHSRGGKTALLAGVLDDRATIVNPNDSGCGGAGCYHNSVFAITEDGDEKREESVEAIIDQFDYWFSEKFRVYYNNVEEMPFDAHYLKALVAPRVLLEGNAASDLWANPVGSFQTASAASEVYKFLDVRENHYWYYRTGYHDHLPEDVERLAKLMLCGKGTDDEYYVTPFEKPEPIYDWRCPKAD